MISKSCFPASLAREDFGELALMIAGERLGGFGGAPHVGGELGRMHAIVEILSRHCGKGPRSLAAAAAFATAAKVVTNRAHVASSPVAERI